MFDVVLVSFEGPDRYSFVGGLATRMNDLAEALVARGTRVHHLFVGDPALPGREERHEGLLTLHRWCQWISALHPRDVYDGEDGKWRDLTASAPPHLVEQIIAPAAHAGRRCVVLFEDWQTAGAAIATAALLGARGLEDAAQLFWNANNTYGLEHVDIEALANAAAITTVSRFMRAELAHAGVDAQVLPNGLAERYLRPLPPRDAAELRGAFGERPTYVKVARFDPDKRWLWAVDAVAELREAGRWPRLVMRGSRSAYGAAVEQRISWHHLELQRLSLAAEAPLADVTRAIAQSTADVILLDFFIAERVLRALYAGADGVLANSEKEPFGLVGLEVMACGGIPFVGRTGEDYAIPFGNAVVVQSDDPAELLALSDVLARRPELAARIREEGRATAERFGWPRVLDVLDAAWEVAFR